MGLKDLFTARKQDSSCCGAQIVPDDDDQPQSEQGTPTETAAVEVQPNASVAVTTYTPTVLAVILGKVGPLLHA